MARTGCMFNVRLGSSKLWSQFEIPFLPFIKANVHVGRQNSCALISPSDTHSLSLHLIKETTLKMRAMFKTQSLLWPVDACWLLPPVVVAKEPPSKLSVP